MQISENLDRLELSVLERASHITEWVSRSGIQGQVVPKSGPGRPEGIVAKAARTLPIQGKTLAAREKTVRRARQIDQISQDAKELLRKAGLEDNQSALLDVAGRPNSESQLKRVLELAQDSTLTKAIPSNGDVGARRPGLAELITDERKFDVALLTPNRQEMKLAGKVYADPETLMNNFPLHRVMQDNAAIITVTALSETRTVFDLMRACGFGAAKRLHVLLLQRANSPDVSTAKAMVVVERVP